MTFDSQKELNQVKKTYLVRIRPGVDLTSKLVTISANTYRTYLPGYLISAVLLNGVDLAKTTGTPTNGQYRFIEDSGELTICSTSAPSSDNVFIAFHSLLFTNDIYRYILEEPTDPASPLREWQPRLTNQLSFSQSIENIIEGILSISSSNINLKNQDGYLQQFLTKEDSFFNKAVEVWLSLSPDVETDSFKKIFEGIVTEIRINDGEVSLSVQDVFSKLKQPATFSTPSEFLKYNNSSLTGWSVAPNKQGVNVPMVVGKFSYYELKNAEIASLPKGRLLVEDSLLEAVCTNYNASLSQTNNRFWGLCLTFGSVSTPFYVLKAMSVDNSNASFTRIYGIAAPNPYHSLFIGDQITFVKPGTGYKYLNILYVDYVNEYVYLEKDAALDGSWYFTAADYLVTAFIEKDGVYTRLKQDRDFTVGNTFVPSVDGSEGKNFIYMALNNSMETSLGIGTIDPVNDRIFFRIRFGDLKHGEVLRRALISAGIQIDEPTFTQANIDLPVNCNFQIPYTNESDINPYYNYIQDILKSTLGYFTLSDDFRVQYKLFKLPTGTETIDETYIDRGSFNIEIKYRDIATEIIAYNLHLNAEDITSKSTTVTPSKTLKNKRSLYLHQYNNTDQFVHVLDNIVPTLQKILAIRSQRRVNYKMNTNNINLDTKLGDEFLIDHPQTLTTFSESVVVISKDGDEIVLADMPL